MARHGSEKRKKSLSKAFRFSEAEWAEMQLRADTAGTSVAAYMRMQCLDAPPPRQVRRPTVNARLVGQFIGLLGRLLGHLGKIGSNLNQIAVAANVGRTLENSLEVAIAEHAEITASVRADVTDMRTSLFESMGREP